MLILSIAVFLYFFISRIVLSDVYEYAVVGAIYEILWLFMWILLILIPILSISNLLNATSPKWLPVLSIMFIAAAISLIFS